MKLLEGLPTEIKNKINKTKQTRGAQPYNRVPFQNRVNRTGIPLVPYAFRNKLHPDGFVNGYRILVRPGEYFEHKWSVRKDFDANVTIGNNAFIYYDNRRDWKDLPPLSDWRICESRDGTGHFIARVPATTANDPDEAREIVSGEPQGIRFFEYASPTDVEHTIAQLAWLAWQTRGIMEVCENDKRGIPLSLKTYIEKHALADIERFIQIGAVAKNTETGNIETICPLCRAIIDASGLMTRLEQAEGREVVDLTVTEINLFHLRDLRPGEYNHRPFMVAWGHHHCNTVARDMGVTATVQWMNEVLKRHGYETKK